MFFFISFNSNGRSKMIMLRYWAFFAAYRVRQIFDVPHTSKLFSFFQFQFNTCTIKGVKSYALYRLLHRLPHISVKKYFFPFFLSYRVQHKHLCCCIAWQPLRLKAFSVLCKPELARPLDSPKFMKSFCKNSNQLPKHSLCKLQTINKSQQLRNVSVSRLRIYRLKRETSFRQGSNSED